HYSPGYLDSASIQLCPLSLHDALPISLLAMRDDVWHDASAYCSGIVALSHIFFRVFTSARLADFGSRLQYILEPDPPARDARLRDRKSTRLNSSHEWISYAVFCLKKQI